MSDPAVPAGERRTHRRRPLHASMWVASDGTKIPVSTVNVSVGGAAVRATVSASVGESVTLEVAPAAGAPFVLSAKVIRVDAGLLGLRFLALGQRALEALLEASGASGAGATEGPSCVHHVGSDEAPG
jgi:hypothetical protein